MENGVDTKHIETLIGKIDSICQSCIALKNKLSWTLEHVSPAYLPSAINLIYYLALRKNDIRILQEQLADLGISSLGKPESHVMTNLLSVKQLLHLLINKPISTEIEPSISIKQGSKLLSEHTDALFGKSSKPDRVKIMVTLSNETASNYDYVETLLRAGADCVRINCAHDNEEVWLKIINHVKQAANKLNKNCPIFMDLGGPKLRTGVIAQGKKVMKLRPSKNTYGEVISPFMISLIPERTATNQSRQGKLVVENTFFSELIAGHKIRFADMRGGERNFKVESVNETEAVLELNRTAYISEDTKLNFKAGSKKIISQILDFPANDPSILLKKGDELVLHLSTQEGEDIKYDAEGRVIPAHISCTVSEVYTSVKIGERVKFDDGTVEGVVKEINNERMSITITATKLNGSMLRADKSINFPDSNLELNGLTLKDKQDLKFVVKYADAINMSFVNRPEDVEEMLVELKALNAQKIGIAFKIETQQGFQNLPMIILKAMKHYPIGIFIARGDLAVEAGWERMAELQEEILWLSEAAHLPNIWGTQVLESMIKTGIPSRAEITDAAMSQRAECVMLNKGKFALETIEMLNNILGRMHEHQYKKNYRLRKLQITDLI